MPTGSRPVRTDWYDLTIQNAVLEHEGIQVTELSGYGEQVYGYLLGLNGLMIVALELPLTSWTRRFNPQHMMALDYSLIGMGLALLAFDTSLPMLVLSIVILTIGEMIALPISSSYVAELAPENKPGASSLIPSPITTSPLISIRSNIPRIASHAA